MPKKTVTVREALAGEEIELEEKPAAQPVKRSGFVAFAPFEYGGVQYVAGDTFDHAGLARDPEFDKFRTVDKQRAGLAFVGKDDRRFILPVMEA